MPFERQVKIKHYHERSDTTEKTEDEQLLIQELKPLLLSIVERAFRRYCKRHNADKATEDLEWKRFKRILNGML